MFRHLFLCLILQQPPPPKKKKKKKKKSEEAINAIEVWKCCLEFCEVPSPFLLLTRFIDEGIAFLCALFLRKLGLCWHLKFWTLCSWKFVDLEEDKHRLVSSNFWPHQNSLLWRSAGMNSRLRSSRPADQRSCIGAPLTIFVQTRPLQCISTGNMRCLRTENGS